MSALGQLHRTNAVYGFAGCPLCLQKRTNRRDISGCPLCANRVLMQRSKKQDYSITSSARLEVVPENTLSAFCRATA
jgi:hypothetical protein